MNLVRGLATRRQVLAAAAAALASAAGLGACGPAGPKGSGVTPLFLEGTGDQALFQQMIPAFEADHRGIRVRWGLLQPGQEGDVNASILAGMGPDVLWASDPGPYVRADLILPLDGWVESQHYDLSDFPPRLLSWLRRQGQLWGLPRRCSTGALLVNNDLLMSAHVSPPDPGYTATDLANLWSRLTGGGQIGGQLPWDPSETFLLNGWGAHLVDPANPRHCVLDSTPGIACGRWMRDRLLRDRSVQGLQGQQADASFTQGTLAMEVVSAEGILAAASAAMSIPWSLLPFPRWPAGPATFAHSDCYVVSRGTKHPDAAWTLLTWVSSANWQRAAMQSAPVPPARLSLWSEYLDVLARAAPPLASRNLQVFSQPVTQGWAMPQEVFWDQTAAAPVLNTYWQRIFATGALGVAKGLAQAASAVDATQK